MICNPWLCEGDELNFKGTRKITNMPKEEYNCGGYALETFNWYCPYERELRGRIFNPWDEVEFTIEESLEITVNFMLNEFKGMLRLIENVKELKENEYAIAFRIGDDDFHYAKRSRNGRWYHKMGGSPRIETMTKEEVFGKSWCYGHYYSKVVLFAKVR